MELLLWVPVLPLAGAVVLFATRGELPKPWVSAIGVGSVGLSAAAAVAVAGDFLASSEHVFRQQIWTWMSVGDFAVDGGLYLDALSLVMMLVVTIVGLLIHIYSTEFMGDDDGYSRYFAYMNLFVAAMLILVLADNLLLLYIGWEGVGLCSYLLIGFWYRDPANGRAACKAFIVTRVGDTAMLIGLIVLATQLATLDIQELMLRAGAEWTAGAGIAVAAAALLLGGAVGKSAQLPLQTWLPDAMAGPTPVSALIHAATMVTAGMYLIARMHEVFILAPAVQFIVAVIGAATLLLAGFSALAQRDIKRILAYSTISQIGYMFLALGVGAWASAVFHFMTHAFFKALLFLAAGAVILALDHEHDIFRMGGLRARLRSVFWAFLIGGGALAALPLVTSGFYSKDRILSAAWAADSGNAYLWLAALAGAFLTSLYIFRLIFIVFFDEARTPVTKTPGNRMVLPLVLLSALSLTGGFVETPATLGGITLFSDLLRTALPESTAHAGAGLELGLQLVAAAASVGGVFVAYLFFLRKPARPVPFAGRRTSAALHRFWAGGWGFDRLYETLFVRPFVAFARRNRDDVTDRFYDGIAFSAAAGWRVLRLTQSGQLRWYAAGMAVGIVLVLGLTLLT